MASILPKESALGMIMDMRDNDDARNIAQHSGFKPIPLGGRKGMIPEGSSSYTTNKSMLRNLRKSRK